MRKRIVAMAAASVVALSAVATASPAAAGPGFALATSGGTTMIGHAEVGGTIIWHNAREFSVKVGALVDKCPPDGAGAYLHVRARRGDNISNWVLVGQDSSGCNDGKIFADTVGPFVTGDVIGAAQVRLMEIDVDDPSRVATAADIEYSEWKWNPDR